MDGKLKALVKMQYVDSLGKDPKIGKQIVGKRLEAMDNKGILPKFIEALDLKNILERQVKDLSGGEL